MTPSLPLPAALPLDTASWEQTPLVVRQVVVQLLAIIQQQEARIAPLEARVSQSSSNSDRPPSSDPLCISRRMPRIRAAASLGQQQPGAASSRRKPLYPPAWMHTMPLGPVISTR